VRGCRRIRKMEERMQRCCATTSFDLATSKVSCLKTWNCLWSNVSRVARREDAEAWRIASRWVGSVTPRLAAANHIALFACGSKPTKGDWPVTALVYRAAALRANTLSRPVSLLVQRQHARKRRISNHSHGASPILRHHSSLSH